MSPCCHPPGSASHPWLPTFPWGPHVPLLRPHPVSLSRVVPPRHHVPVAPVVTVAPAVALFSLVGFVQMAIWAQGKHRSYLREFRDYPPLRSPIIPFLL